ncbi:MAG: hypothetical protein R3B60_02890 [Candidatus Paceibacterota bacterium]
MSNTIRVYLNDNLLRKKIDQDYPYISDDYICFGTNTNSTHKIFVSYDVKNGFYVAVPYEPKETLTLNSLIIPNIKFISFVFTDKELLYSKGSYQKGSLTYRTERDVIPDKKIQFENSDLTEKTGKVCVKANTVEEFNVLMDKFFKGELVKDGVDKTAREIAVEYQPRLQAKALKLESNLWIKIGYGLGLIPDNTKRKLSEEELRSEGTPYLYIVRNIHGLNSYISKTMQTRWYRIGCLLRFC